MPTPSSIPTSHWPIGTRVRFINPRIDQMHMLHWEGVVTQPRYGENTVLVRLEDPQGIRAAHTEGYYRTRLEEVTEASGPAIQRTIQRLQKRQHFYKNFKQQLPTWYAAYGD